MKKRLTALLMIAALALTGLTACSGEEAAEEVEQVIRVGHAYDATTLDPQDCYDDGSYSVLINTGEGLLVGYEGEVHPGLAESWEVSEDGMHYTFHLRESKWADGTPLTAKDFVYSAKRILNPDSAFEQAQSFYALKNGEKCHLGEVSFDDVGISAPDDLTLEIEMEEPNSDFLFTVSGYYWLPVNEEKCEAEGELYGSEADKVLSNGPFTCTEWAHESKIILEKNPNYWNADNVKITKIDITVNATAEVARDMFLAGDLDTYEFTGVETISQLKDKTNSYTFTSTYAFCHLNCAGHDEEMGRFMGNANFRKALSCAISREDILTITGVTGTAAYRFAAPNLVTADGKTWDEEYPLTGWSTKAEPEKAKEYLDAALTELNATVDDIPTISMLCFDSQANMEKYQAIQDMLLQTLGLKSEINPQPIQQMLDMADNGEFDFWLGGKMMEVPDWIGEAGYEYDSTNTSAIMHYVNPTYSEMMDQATRAADLKDREAIVYEMEKILCDDMVTLLLYWQESCQMFVPELKGIVNGNGLGPYYAQAYFAAQ